jgi:hypothetical protein
VRFRRSRFSIAALRPFTRAGTKSRPKDLSRKFLLVLRSFESLVLGREQSISRCLFHGQDQICTIATEWKRIS